MIVVFFQNINTSKDMIKQPQSKTILALWLLVIPLFNVKFKRKDYRPDEVFIERTYPSKFFKTFSIGVLPIIAD